MLKKDIYNKAGMLMGIVSSVVGFMLLVFIFKYSETPYAIFSSLGITIPVTFIFLTGIYFRGARRDLPLSFVHLLKMGWWITILSSVLFATFYYYYIKLDEVAFLTGYIDEYKNFIAQTKDVTAEHFKDKTFEEVIETMNDAGAFDFVARDFIWKTLAGSVASLIIAIILRK